MSHATIQTQMRLREGRTCDLRDLLGLAGEPPTSADPNQDEDTWYKPIIRVQHPTIVGRFKQLHMDEEKGLPKHLPPPDLHALWRDFRDGVWPASNTWAPPVQCAAQMKLTLTDPLELPGSPRRLNQITFRALPLFQGTIMPHFGTIMPP